MNFRIINQCDEIFTHVFNTIAYIEYDKNLITLTNKAADDIIYILHHEYLHAILNDIICNRAAGDYDNICDYCVGL